MNSVEEINQDLVDYASWDMESPVAALSLELGEGVSIKQCSLNIFGESDPKRLDARVVFCEAYKETDHQIKMERVEPETWK